MHVIPRVLFNIFTQEWKCNKKYEKLFLETFLDSFHQNLDPFPDVFSFLHQKNQTTYIRDQQHYTALNKQTNP